MQGYHGVSLTRLATQPILRAATSGPYWSRSRDPLCKGKPDLNAGKAKRKLKIAAAAECCLNCLVRTRCLNLGVCLGFFAAVLDFGASWVSFLRPYDFLVPLSSVLKISDVLLGTALCRISVQVLVSGWFGHGSGMVRARWVRAWFGRWVVRAWFGHGSGMVRARGAVRAWFGHGSGNVVRAWFGQRWFGHGSGMVRARGGLGSDLSCGMVLVCRLKDNWLFIIFSQIWEFFIQNSCKRTILQQNQRICSQQQGQWFFVRFSGANNEGEKKLHSASQVCRESPVHTVGPCRALSY